MLFKVLFLVALLSAIDVSHQLAVPTPSKTNTNTILWLRDHSLRIQDNEAAYNAMLKCQSSSSLIPIYLWGKNDDSNGGTASELFIAHALKSLDLKLHGKIGHGCVEVETKTMDASGEQNADFSDMIDKNALRIAEELASICNKLHSSEIYYIRSNNIPFEDRIIHHLQQKGIVARDYFGCSLLDYSKVQVPWKELILSHPFRSPLIPFVDFVLARLSEHPPPEPIDIPMDKFILSLGETETDPSSSSIFSHPVDLDSKLQRLGKSQGGENWGKTVIESFSKNNEDALKELDSFFITSSNAKNTNQKYTHFTSRLSPYLARGILSPRQVYHTVLSHSSEYDLSSLLRRLCWRDYTYALSSLFPDMSLHPIRRGYDHQDSTLTREKHHFLEMWKCGKTGIPIVDAGMRQLQVEGFMPQKVRLVCSTYLVEGLNISWQHGMQHFKEYLIDFDQEINCAMWQNAGFVGLDPYYVGLKYRKRAYWDRDGSYVRKWCPELKNLEDYVVLDQGRGVTKKIDCLYEPWSAPDEALEKAGVELGETYPLRICDDRLNRQKLFNRLRVVRTSWPEDMVDECKRDIVPLGREPAAERIGMFTPRAFQLRSS
mmetsp:Transcript_21933/g.32840  ORF Transcript_21933/g.32840 Transcript_21933/m.32840 type:complete len:601 (+) Transcript_21933:78-1880(+)